MRGWGEFARFYIYEAGKLVESENLPDLEMMAHSITTTREHYPKIWSLAQAEKSATAKSAPRRQKAPARGKSKARSTASKREPALSTT